MKRVAWLVTGTQRLVGSHCDTAPAATPQLFAFIGPAASASSRNPVMLSVSLTGMELLPAAILGAIALHRGLLGMHCDEMNGAPRPVNVRYAHRDRGQTVKASTLEPCKSRPTRGVVTGRTTPAGNGAPLDRCHPPVI